MAAHAADIGVDERPGIAFTHMFVVISNSQFEPGPLRSLMEPTYTSDFYCREGARPEDRINPHGGPDGARTVLGRKL